VLLILCNTAYTQNYSYKYISTKDGLPSSTITGITKDKNGVIWIGTEKGLCYIGNGKIQQFRGLPDEGVLSVFASSDGSLWVSFGIKQFLVKIKDGKITSFSNEQKAKNNGSVLAFFEHENHIYLAQNDGITVVSPEGKFKPLTNKIKSDTMMSYWTVDFFTHNSKVYATSVLRGINEITVHESNVTFKNIYKGDFLYGSTCVNNNLILTFDPEAKLYNAKNFLGKQNQTPLKTISSRRPAIFVSDKNNNIFGGSYNINYGIHGLIKLNSKFDEELILPDNIPGQELFYDQENNEVYFGTGFGVYIVNAALYSKFLNVKKEQSEKPIIASYPTKDGIVALTEGGLFCHDASNSVRKQITITELRNFANRQQAKPSNTIINTKVNHWTEATFNGFQLDDLKFVNDKWFVLSKIGFFIINKQFILEDFIPIPASNINFTKDGEFVFDQYRLSLIALKNTPKQEVIFDCFRQDKFVLKHLSGIERFGQKTIIVTENQGVFSYNQKALHPIKLKGLNSDVYRSTSFQNKYLVISTVNGELLFYDSEQNFSLVKTIKKSQFYYESIIDLKGNDKYLVFITAKRIFIWDGKTLKSYNEYQNGVDIFHRVNLNGDNLAVYSPKSIIRIELAKLQNEIDKKIVFNVTNQFTKKNDPVFNTLNLFYAKNQSVTLQFFSFNELNTEVLKGYYRFNQNDWIEIDQSGKIYLQNLDYGDTEIEFKVMDKRSGNISWTQKYTIKNPAPWYLSIVAISIYLLLFSALLIFSTRFFVTQSKKKEIERLTINNRFNELQMEALQSQMNPHFVFNALNSVQKFILNIDQEKALLFLNQFSVLIRKVLDFSSLKSITIEEELEFLTLYISIENQRFQDSIHVEQDINCDDEIMIPPLLIQPLIENAIIYGLRSDLGAMQIYFSIVQEENMLRIEIKNEINLEITKNHSFQSKSTEIIQKRLALYDANASIKSTTENGFFIATILLPVNE
jgi:hypothetical protein